MNIIIFLLITVFSCSLAAIDLPPIQNWAREQTSSKGESIDRALNIKIYAPSRIRGDEWRLDTISLTFDFSFVGAKPTKMHICQSDIQHDGNKFGHPCREAFPVADREVVRLEFKRLGPRALRTDHKIVIKLFDEHDQLIHLSKNSLLLISDAKKDVFYWNGKAVNGGKGQ